MPELKDHAITFTPRLTDDEFYEFCRRHDDMNFEVTKEGTICMMTPAGNESSMANAEIIRQLGNWWHTHKRGRVFDSNTVFVLPDGSQRGPDAAYITDERLAAMPRETLRSFGHVCPNFVIELLSRTDSLETAIRKMRDDWMANGVELGWLIDPHERLTYCYSGATESSTSASELSGTGPVEGFTLDLTEVWRAYD